MAVIFKVIGRRLNSSRFLIAVKPLCTLIAATVVKTGDVSLISTVAATADDQDYNYNPPAIVSSESTSVSKHIV